MFYLFLLLYNLEEIIYQWALMFHAAEVGRPPPPVTSTPISWYYQFIWINLNATRWIQTVFNTSQFFNGLWNTESIVESWSLREVASNFRSNHSMLVVAIVEMVKFTVNLMQMAKLKNAGNVQLKSNNNRLKCCTRDLVGSDFFIWQLQKQKYILPVQAQERVAMSWLTLERVRWLPL